MIPSIAPKPRYLPLLLLLFVGSGCAALIYEIVWLQLLQLVIGSSGISLGVLLGTFMGGMCLGSLILPYLIPARWHPLRVYAILEIGIGIMGLAVLFGTPYVEAWYTHNIEAGPNNIWLRAAVAAVCLLPPTLLMGATLPAIARWVETTRQGVSWLGFFYGGNIIGAVAGCLAAGFFLLRVYDMPTATYVAVGINVLVAVFALMIAANSPYQRQVEAFEPETDNLDVALDAPLESQLDAMPEPGGKVVYLIIALSGLGALASEVIWTRLLSLLLGATVYTFSIILAVFLVGLGIGSTAGASIGRNTPNPRRALGICQLLLALGVAWAAWVIAKSLPYWPVDPEIMLARPKVPMSPGEVVVQNPLLLQQPWFTFQLDLVRAAWAILPASILWGASFPLALAAVARRGRDAGRMVGRVYAANTVGAIVGSIAFSLWIIPKIGTQNSQRIVVVLSAFSALLALWPCLFGERKAVESDEPENNGRAIASVIMALLVAVGIGALTYNVSVVPWTLVAWGRYSATKVIESGPGMIPTDKWSFNDSDSQGYDRFCTYVGEGMNVSVAVTRTREGFQYFHGAGKVQASSNPQDMRLQRMLGHLSVLAHPEPDKVQDVLVVACGAGVTAGSFIPYPNTKKIVICDIEPLVPTKVTPLFNEQNYYITNGLDDQHNPREVPPGSGRQVKVVYDDGRHFVRTTHDKFDIITSDPIDPWVKGCAALNTVEYYEMCKSHLKPGGVMSLWIPLYESDLATAKSVIATFFKVFPNGILFSNDIGGEGYDAVLFGVNQPDEVKIDLDAVQKLLERPEYARVRGSLTEVGFGKTRIDGGEGDAGGIVTELMATYAGHAKNLGPWMADAQLNYDRNLRLQYLAGMWLNSYIAKEILDSVFVYYKFPDELFAGTEDQKKSLRRALEQANRNKARTDAVSKAVEEFQQNQGRR